MGELIPLFPLGTPLFPGVVLPLQIFEPRYRRLMHDLEAHPEDDGRRFFGVVAIRQGWDHIIGSDGIFIGMSSFGASGPYKELYKHFGITPEAVVAAAEAKLG